MIQNEGIPRNTPPYRDTHLCDGSSGIDSINDTSTALVELIRLEFTAEELEREVVENVGRSGLLVEIHRVRQYARGLLVLVVWVN
jgi:hypothetical protein